MRQDRFTWKPGDIRKVEPKAPKPKPPVPKKTPKKNSKR